MGSRIFPAQSAALKEFYMSTPLSAYEIERLKNIERNQAVLAQLGLEALAPPKPTIVRKPKV